MRIYNKLVRDKIPTIIEEGEKSKIRILDNEEYKKELDKKLVEEVNEYLNDSNVEELADIVEVIYEILKSMSISVEEFEKITKSKVEKRGAFQNKVFLEHVQGFDDIKEKSNFFEKIISTEEGNLGAKTKNKKI